MFVWRWLLLCLPVAVYAQDPFEIQVFEYEPLPLGAYTSEAWGRNTPAFECCRTFTHHDPGACRSIWDLSRSSPLNARCSTWTRARWNCGALSRNTSGDCRWTETSFSSERCMGPVRAMAGTSSHLGGSPGRLGAPSRRASSTTATWAGWKSPPARSADPPDISRRRLEARRASDLELRCWAWRDGDRQSGDPQVADRIRIWQKHH
jgi:hypothetical protein